LQPDLNCRDIPSIRVTDFQSERQHEEIIKPTKHFVGTHPAGTRANLGAGLSRSGPEPYRVSSE
jgi:hypothetical protein